MTIATMLLFSGMQEAAFTTLETLSTSKLVPAPLRLVDALEHLKLLMLLPRGALTLVCEHVEIPCPKLLITMLGADPTIRQWQLRIIGGVGNTTLRISGSNSLTTCGGLRRREPILVQTNLGALVITYPNHRDRRPGEATPGDDAPALGNIHLNVGLKLEECPHTNIHAEDYILSAKLLSGSTPHCLHRMKSLGYTWGEGSQPFPMIQVILVTNLEHHMIGWILTLPQWVIGIFF